MQYDHRSAKRRRFSLSEEHMNEVTIQTSTNLDNFGPRPSETSLCYMTRRFVHMLQTAPNGFVNMNEAAEVLDVQKRRIYDIINVLEGVKLAQKINKNCIQWIGAGSSGITSSAANEFIAECSQLRPIVDKLKDYEDRLDGLITLAESERSNLAAHSQRYGYVTHGDLRSLKCFDDSAIIGAKSGLDSAPLSVDVKQHETTLELRLTCRLGGINVCICPADDIPPPTPPAPQPLPALSPLPPPSLDCTAPTFAMETVLTSDTPPDVKATSTATVTTSRSMASPEGKSQPEPDLNESASSGFFSDTNSRDSLRGHPIFGNALISDQTISPTLRPSTTTTNCLLNISDEDFALPSPTAFSPRHFRIQATNRHGMPLSPLKTPSPFTTPSPTKLFRSPAATPLTTSGPTVRSKARRRTVFNSPKKMATLEEESHVTHVTADDSATGTTPKVTVPGGKLRAFEGYLGSENVPPGEIDDGKYTKVLTLFPM